MYEMEGALSSPPSQIGQLPGLPGAARRPPGPDSRSMYRLPGPFYVSEVALRWCPFPAVKAFLLPPGVSRKGLPQFIFSFSFIHTMSTGQRHLFARHGGYPPAYAQDIHR